MQHKISTCLLDIANSIKSIEDYLGDNKDFTKFEKNKMVRRAVERELEIIGEAVNRILKINPNYEIADARRIVNLRNIVIHAYDNIDNIVLWGIISKDIPILKTRIEALIQNQPSQPEP